ncbi:helix-turn-helix domain-containing protein [Trueperella pyogenes]|uniref:helix-turn-helix domain-containing protein n=1 Tax=Trueperella pyogenes TaxID=1661 RepID=UPI00345DC29F
MMRLLSTGKAAEAFDVTSQTVRRWIDTGKIAAVVLPSGQLRIPASEVERILTPIAPAAPLADSEDSSGQVPGQGMLL